MKISMHIQAKCQIGIIIIIDLINVVAEINPHQGKGSALALYLFVLCFSLVSPSIARKMRPKCSSIHFSTFFSTIYSHWKKFSIFKTINSSLSVSVIILVFYRSVKRFQNYFKQTVLGHLQSVVSCLCFIYRFLFVFRKTSVTFDLYDLISLLICSQK